MGSVTVGNVRELIFVIGDEFAKSINIFESINPDGILLSRGHGATSRMVDGVVECSYADRGWQAMETRTNRAIFWFLRHLRVSFGGTGPTSDDRTGIRHVFRF